MNKSTIRKYARLIVTVGANVQPGQPVIIRAAVDQYEFVTMLTEECYAAGASYVRTDWKWQPITKLDYLHQSLETLSTVLPWQEERAKQATVDLPATIHILSEDPNGLSGIDQEKLQRSLQATYPILKPYRDALENKTQWTIAAVPSVAWAVQVFPELSESEAVERLWQEILQAVHVTSTNDPAQAWKEHNRRFEERCAWLNAQHFDRIVYKSANGTDFWCDLMPESMWCGGSEDTLSGITFNPNMPTEEIFTTPMKGRCAGKLVATKPLSYQGRLIDGFSVTFRDGRAVEWEAREGEEALAGIITTDEGSRMLGELALVPVSSPISQSGILFYETLFDENAGCHVALGMGFNDCVRGFEALSNEECKSLGVNDSLIHVDFMIGARDLCITGMRGEEAVPILVNGEWA